MYKYMFVCVSHNRRTSKAWNKAATKTNNTSSTCTECLFWSHYATHSALTTQNLFGQTSLQFPSAMHICGWQQQYSSSASTSLSLKVACSWPGGGDSEWSVDSVITVDHHEYGYSTNNIVNYNSKFRGAIKNAESQQAPSCTANLEWKKTVNISCSKNL